MNKIDFTLVQLDKLITHHVGNKMNEEGTILSEEPTNIKNETLDYLLKYFLQPFSTEEMYHFAHHESLEENEVYALAKSIFESRDNLAADSQKLATRLYDSSSHPKIKSGEFNVAYFSEIALHDEVVEAIGLFKSETNVPFLKMETNQKNFIIEHDFGFAIKNIDKGCLIFNTAAENGYEVLAIDNTNKNDAQFWKNAFLQLKPVSNEYHQTNSFLHITKNYLTDQVTEDFQINRSEQINLLNRSVDYFKEHEVFDKEEFEAEVLKDDKMIESFRNYDADYRMDQEVAVPDNFSISAPAVKKQSKAFKSVIKLDKNFHIYIHGDEGAIEHGVDADGRKYYKLYFEEEA